LFRYSGVQFRLVLGKLSVFLQPLVQLDQLKRISTGHKHLSEQIIGIKRDRSDKRVELFGRDRFRVRRVLGLNGGRRSEEQ
jgi:hypothetical protein